MDVPSPSEPLFVRRIHSVRPNAEFLVENASTDDGDVVETFVRIDAMRLVEVAVVVAFAQFASEQNVDALKRRPVPMPAAAEVVERCVSESASVTAVPTLSILVA